MFFAKGPVFPPIEVEQKLREGLLFQTYFSLVLLLLLLVLHLWEDDVISPLRVPNFLEIRSGRSIWQS